MSDTNTLISLFSAGRFAEMESLAKTILKANARSALANELLGIALVAQGRPAEALSPLRTAARIEPNDAQFWENLALCQRQLDQFGEAESSLRKSLALRPDSVEALKALASILRQLGRHDEAENVLRRVLTLKPNDAAAYFNLGNVLSDKGAFSAAEASFRHALAINPAELAAYANLGGILVEAGRYQEAVDTAQAVVDRVGDLSADIPPTKKDALDAAASVFCRAGRYGLAARIYARTAGHRKSVSRAMIAFSAARRACDWDLAQSIEADWKHQKGMLRDHSSPYPLLMMASATPADQLAGARAYAKQFATIARLPAGPLDRQADGKRLRIGYLSNDFSNHATAHLLAGVIEKHDRDRFEVFAYDYTPPTQDEYRRRLEKSFDGIVSIHDLSFRDAADRIARDSCNIAIDLKGWTGGTRSPVLAARPAPVQVQWLGYPGTMGASWIDYVIADEVLIRPGEESHYSEKIVRLPGSYQPTDDKRQIGPPPDRSSCGLPENGFVFCSFNQPFKIIAEIFDVWMKLLKAVDGSVLWLLQLTTEAAQALTAAAGTRGISEDRIIFAPFLPSREHLARVGHADLGLDCFPYGSHTTASDMLWAGIPIVALAGETFASRVSASILRAAGLPDLITTSMEDYSSLALRLAEERDELARLRARIADSRRGSSLFDTERFTRKLEAAYSAMWPRHLLGEAPDHLTVD
jgi:protein O-GlcNAc transferase